MAHLVAIAYPDQQRASEAIDVLRRLADDGTIRLDDVAAVSRDDEGGLKLDHALGQAAAGAAGGLFLGALLGVALLAPLAGALFGTAVGAMAGKMAGVARGEGSGGRFADFERRIAEALPPESSGGVMLVHGGDDGSAGECAATAIEALRGLGGTVIETTLPDDVEDRLRAALSPLASA